MDDEACRASFDARDWRRLGELLDAGRDADPIAARYWDLRWAAFELRLTSPEAEWAKLYARAKGHPKARAILIEVLRASVQAGRSQTVVERSLAELGRVFRIPCPAVLVPGLAAYFMQRGEHARCLRLLDEVEARAGSEDVRRTLALRNLRARIECEAKLGVRVLALSLTQNPFSDALRTQMHDAFPTGSAPAQVLHACDNVWKALPRHGDQLFLDVRHHPAQLAALRASILKSVNSCQPFSLVRVGDADSYAFADEPAHSLPQSEVKRIEHAWWGRAPTPAQRQVMRQGFVHALQKADVIGLPCMHRLARDLTVSSRTEPSTLEARYLCLFEGILSTLAVKDCLAPRRWVDEYCNFELVEPAFLKALQRQSRGLIVVTGFAETALVRKRLRAAVVIPIPPHARVQAVGSSHFDGRTLPEVLGQVWAQLQPLLKPGTVVLVSAGFGGKTLIGRARDAGAVALDLGSALDHVLGYSTRSLDLNVGTHRRHGTLVRVFRKVRDWWRQLLLGTP